MLQLTVGEPAEVGFFLGQGSLHILDGSQVVEMSRIELLPPIYGAVVPIVEQPHFTSAFGRVKICRRAENFEENVLHDVLSLGGVADDLLRDAVNQSVVAVVENGERVLIAGLKLGHQLLISQT